MTTIIRGERWRHGRHLAEVGVYLFLAAISITPWLPTPPRVVGALIAASTIAVLIVSMQHTRELCERCITRVPLDPTAAVKRFRPVLKAVHHLKWLLVPIAVLMIADLVLPAKSWEAHLASSLMTCGCLALIVCCNRHRVLAPWCPWCHPGGGGGGAGSLAPDGPPGRRMPTPA